MKILIVEDDLVSRKVISKLLSTYGDYDIAVDGEEALTLFKLAIEEEEPYTLVALDIMIPKMNGQDVLKEMRAYEAEKKITGNDGAKIIMTTALDDRENIMNAFKSQCEAYLTKPISKEKLEKEMKKLGLIS